MGHHPSAPLPLAWEARPPWVGVWVASGGSIRSRLVAQGLESCSLRGRTPSKAVTFFLVPCLYLWVQRTSTKGPSPRGGQWGKLTGSWPGAWLPHGGAPAGNDSSSDRHHPGAHLLLPRSQSLCGHCTWEAFPWGWTLPVHVERGPIVVQSCGEGRGRG